MRSAITRRNRRLGAAGIGILASVVMVPGGAAFAGTGSSPPGTGSSPPNGPPAGQIKVIASGLNQPKKITRRAGRQPSRRPLRRRHGPGELHRRHPNLVSRLVWSHRPDQCPGQGVHPDGRPAVGLLRRPGRRGGRAGGGQNTSTAAFQVLFQNTNINRTTGRQSYGPAGRLLGDLVRVDRRGSAHIEARFGPFEAAHNPDHGAGTGVALGADSAIDSDPYSFVPYRGGYAVADAAANDLLWVSPRGHISVLAVFPTITETAAPGTLGPTQTTPVQVQAQAVPDAVTVGPDGALYVGELGGFPFNVGTSSVYRRGPRSPAHGLRQGVHGHR